MKPYGSYNRKARSWFLWGDRIPTKLRRYFNKATRKLFNSNPNIIGLIKIRKSWKYISDIYLKL